MVHFRQSRMNPLQRILIVFASARELGPRSVLLNALYQLILRLGLFRGLTPARTNWDRAETGGLKSLPIELPSREAYEALLGKAMQTLLAEADEIAAGKARLFGSEIRRMVLPPMGDWQHWSVYRSSQLNGEDIKFTWEPGRFGWATVLARAYLASGEERYAEAFWQFTETFMAHNPPNLGPQWVSAQEVALRLMHLTFAFTFFESSTHSTAVRRDWLARVTAAHAERIPPTLMYARAQNNNHLLSDAAGLVTAALALPEHKQARRWRETGLRWFHRGLLMQSNPSGEYMQHSVNYARLVLGLGLWMNLLSSATAETFPAASQDRLAAMTRWQSGLLDGESGSLPNLGHNDGAYIFAFTTTPYADHRPVLGAAQAVFCGGTDLPEDEIHAWLAPGGLRGDPGIPPHPHRLPGPHGWGMLRAVRFFERPGQADQLHVDVWWRGINIARDAGTYLYNADSPWDNGLMRTAVHNTLMVDGQEQMNRVGRFLWLAPATGEITERTSHSISAQHDGYRKLGVTHQRTLRSSDGRWEVTDNVTGIGDHHMRLQWLLPDWPWQLEGSQLQLDSPHGKVQILISADREMQASLARAGERLAGEELVLPIQGWVSPTYGVKAPALSFVVRVEGPLPLQLSTAFLFPDA